MSVPLPFFVEFVIRNLILTTNTFWIALQYALRSTVECYRMLETQSRSKFDTKTGYTFNKTVASVQLSTS